MSKKIGITTTGLSTVTEDIRAALFKTSDPSAVDQSITESAPHNDRLWTFYGLEESVNYNFKIQKLVSSVWIDIPGYYFTFTPDTPQITYKTPVQIQPDVTTGFVSGVAVVVFDGTDGKDDWRGFEIFPDRGAGPMKSGIDYSWDSASGTWSLLQDGDLFQHLEYFTVNFSIITQSSGGGQIASGKQFNNTTVITADYGIQVGDFGNKLIVNGVAISVALILPDIATVPENKLLYIESGTGAHKSVILNTFDNTQKIDWLEGNRIALYMGRCEYLVVYKQIIDSTHQQWRIHDFEGNFKTVGRDFHSYSDITEEINALPVNGGGDDGIPVAGYARLYYDHVLKQDPSKTVAFVDWVTGNNRLKFSLASDGGFFHIPDTRGYFNRNTDSSRDVGIKQDHAIAKHRHEGTVGTLPLALFGRGIVSRLLGKYNGQQNSNTDLTSEPVDSAGNVFPNMDTETRPINNSSNHFILV